MTLKNLVTLLLIAVVAIPQAKAQLGVLNDLLGSINIQGTVLCSSKDNMDINGSANPAFSNAQVQLLCGGKVFSNARTEGDGMFSIMMDPLVYDLSSLLSGCNLVVATPLSNCNSKLPSAGALVSTLRFVGISLLGTRTVANVNPSGFHFMPST
ncbi:phylloplanin-like [Gastrolobium bilobum]|uniref:phylloplanin-like n=1 Tax=Gastrolobium bilobum TaxID=150636 RepID=UPI002AB08922|nr:phylloplanin-like [Gastrolobium bilobum]